MEDFPQEKRLTFANTHDVPLPFPFRAFSKNHHDSRLDISVSFPGDSIDTNTVRTYQWRNVAMTIQVKATADEDPFCTSKPSPAHNDGAVQVARAAHSLLLAHGFLAAFVVGIYGRQARIVRVDHASAVASRAFDVAARPGLLRRFFWRFAHPRVGRTVVGCDPTVAPLAGEDRAWIRETLRAAGERFEDAARDVEQGRRVEVFDDRTGASHWYLLFCVVDADVRRFGSTVVWRALRDTRAPGRGEFRIPETPARVEVLKEVWRPVGHKSGGSLDARLERCFAVEERGGRASLVCGGDMGAREAREWEKASTNARRTGGECQVRLASDLTRSGSSASASVADASPSSNPSSAETVAPFPLPFPQQRTFSWDITCGDTETTGKQCTHTRFVFSHLRQPLSRIKTTRELATALTDAIRGESVPPSQRRRRLLVLTFLQAIGRRGGRPACSFATSASGLS